MRSNCSTTKTTCANTGAGRRRDSTRYLGDGGNSRVSKRYLRKLYLHTCMVIRLWLKPPRGVNSTDGEQRWRPHMHEASYVQLQFLFWMVSLFKPCFGTSIPLSKWFDVDILFFKKKLRSGLMRFHHHKRKNVRQHRTSSWILQYMLQKLHCGLLSEHGGIETWRGEWYWLTFTALFFTYCKNHIEKLLRGFFYLCNSWNKNSWSIQGIFNNPQKSHK